jgi:DHA1 family multidrug resistance protein-like MFS transporter
MERWKKNLYVLFVAELLSIAGLQIIVPFLPLYVKELSPQVSSVEFWSGMVYSAQAFTILIFSPIWGALADRLGRKVMIQRAMLGGAMILGLMAFVKTVGQLVLMRALQGAITGVVPAAYALVAASAPREKTGYAMGIMQMSVWVGMSIGPFIGGVVADLFGFQSAFYLTSACLFLGGLAVTLLVKDDFAPLPTERFSVRQILGGWLIIIRVPHMPEHLSVRFLVQAGQSIVLPFLPLFMALLLTSQKNTSTITGLAVSIMSASGAISAVLLGRVSDHIGLERLLLISAPLVAIAYGLMSLSTESWQLIGLYAVAGGALGGVVPVVAALMGTSHPREQMGSVYGLANSMNAAGRMIAPLLGAAVVFFTALRGVFVASAILFGLIVVLARTMQKTYPSPKKL